MIPAFRPSRIPLIYRPNETAKGRGRRSPPKRAAFAPRPLERPVRRGGADPPGSAVPKAPETPDPDRRAAGTPRIPPFRDSIAPGFRPGREPGLGSHRGPGPAGFRLRPENPPIPVSAPAGNKVGSICSLAVIFVKY
jgi:hypothetical protein